MIGVDMASSPFTPLSIYGSYKRREGKEEQSKIKPRKWKKLVPKSVIPNSPSQLLLGNFQISFSVDLGILFLIYLVFFVTLWNWIIAVRYFVCRADSRSNWKRRESMEELGRQCC
ncbi:hypothetical protein ABKV19_003821 [Rosa sericea]